MYKEFKHINEAVLWDNLKRKANETLKRIDSLSNDEKLKIFNKKYPEELQQLLENIGKEFFKIFLFKAIEDNLKKNRKKNDIIKDTITNFKFYFWPGYTTLKDKRIFITGAKRNQNKTQRFLTGIGNDMIELKSKKLDSFKFYISTLNSKSDNIFVSNDIWLYDVPSTIAFNNALNQFYINEDKNVFTAGSMHKWKSSQFSVNEKTNHKEYISITLPQDLSELRIIEIGTGEINSISRRNKLSIVIKPEKLSKSAEIINKEINKVLFYKSKNKSKEYIERLNQWPRVKPAETSNEELEIIYRLQTTLYSYWISETLDNPKSPKQDYGFIRKEFEKAGFDELAIRLKPFNKFRTTYYKPNKLKSIYYQYWNTIFLESYSETADLGTAMFLTSQQYDSEFWIKCTSTIRQIFNELRIIESIAQTELEDYRTIRHHLNSFVSANRFWQKTNIKDKVNANEYDVLNYFSSTIQSFINLVDEKYTPSKEEIFLQIEILKILEVFRILSINNHIYSKVFRETIDEVIFENHKEINFIKTELIDLKLKNDISVFRLLIKDLIENIVKHSDLNSPDCKITLKKENKYYSLTCLNSKWPDESDLYKMKTNSFRRKTGWKTINENLKLLKWKLFLPTNFEDKRYDHYFWIEIKIPFEK